MFNYFSLFLLFLSTQATIQGSVNFTRYTSDWDTDTIYRTETYTTTLIPGHRSEIWEIDCGANNIDHTLLDDSDGLTITVSRNPTMQFRASIQKDDQSFNSQGSGSIDTEIWKPYVWGDDDTLRVCDVDAAMYYLKIEWEEDEGNFNNEDYATWYVEITHTGDDWDCGGSAAFAAAMGLIILLICCCAICIIGGLVAAGCCVVGGLGAAVFACCSCCMSEKRRADQKKKNSKVQTELATPNQQQPTNGQYQQQPNQGQMAPNPYAGQQVAPNQYQNQQQQPNQYQQPPNQYNNQAPPNHGSAPAPVSGYPAAPSYGNTGNHGEMRE